VNVPAPIVNVAAPELPEITPIVNVAPAQVIVNVPEQKAPEVTVNVPKTDVNVTLQTMGSKAVIKRDAMGNMIEVESVPQAEIVKEE